jgi:hypothetical protein
MRNQRSSQDDRNFGRQGRMQERNYQDNDFEGNDPWRSQERDEEGRFSGSRDQRWRGGRQSEFAVDRDDYGMSGRGGMKSGMGGASFGMEGSMPGGGRGSGNYRQQGQQDQNDQMFDVADRRAAEHDEDFYNWRNEHLSKLDTDYQEWRAERRKKFAEEFEKWRAERNAKQGASQGFPGTGTAQSATGGETTSKKS